MRPVTRKTAFSQTDELIDYDESASAQRRIVLLPSQAFTGATAGATTGLGTLPNRATFQYASPSGRTFTDLSKSYLRVLVRVTRDSGALLPLRTDTGADAFGENNAFARFGAANMFSKATLRIASREIESNTDHAQSTAMLMFATKSRQWMNTTGTMFQAGSDPASRVATSATVDTFELFFRPAIGMFWHSKLVRTGGATFELTLDRRSDFDQVLLVNQGGTTTLNTPVTPAVAGGAIAGGVAVAPTASLAAPGGVANTNQFFVHVDGMEWHVLEIEPEADVPVSLEDIVDASSLRILRANLPNSSIQTAQIVVPPAAFKVLAGYQTDTQGSDATDELSNFEQFDVNTFRVDWGGRLMPDNPYDLTFVAGAGLTKNAVRAYTDFLQAVGQLEGPLALAGASLDYNEWAEDTVLYGFPLVAAKGAKSTNVTIRATFGVAQEGQLLVGIASPNRVFLTYREDGVLSSVNTAESEADVFDILGVE